MDIVRGDWRFFWPDSLLSFIGIPSAWDSSLNTGLGMQATNTMWITSYLHLSATISSLGLGWLWTTFLFWLIPIILISILSSYFLSRYVLRNKSPLLSLVSGVIYATNTYFLLIFFGGQLGVAFAYSLAPVVILSYLYYAEKITLSRGILVGIVAAIQLVFDPRLTMLTLSAAYAVLLISRIGLLKLLKISIVPVIVALSLHAFWIIPTILFHSKTPYEMQSGATVSFLSFALLENTISLLHPNWPQNIFGKVYFMKPEYLIIPIIAYLPIVLGKSKEVRKELLAFAFIALIGAFLAKGVNEPFGFVYQFMSGYIPGFTMFRDPTKFYLLIALSYSVLIPYGIYTVYGFCKKRFNGKIVLNHLILLFLAIWIFLQRDVFLGTVHTPSPQKIPPGYERLAQFISNQNNDFRTLWIPQWQRYGYFSNQNPAIGRGEIPMNKINDERLDLHSIKYVMVPFDSEGEIFINDGKYSEKLFKDTVQKIQILPYLRQVEEFGKIIVFENFDFRKRFYVSDSSSDITFSRKNSIYDLILNKTKDKKTIVFTDNYSQYWYASYQNKTFKSQNYRGVNSFIIPGDVTQIRISYGVQKVVNISFIISLLSLFFLLGFLAFSKIKNDKTH